MTLFSLEYQVKSTGMTFICKVVGNTPEEVIKDIVNQVGDIRILSLYPQSKVDRITEKIQKQMIDKSVSKEVKTRGKGRPRKIVL
mgnify:CR=1 FL=1